MCVPFPATPPAPLPSAEAHTRHRRRRRSHGVVSGSGTAQRGSPTVAAARSLDRNVDNTSERTKKGEKVTALSRGGRRQPATGCTTSRVPRAAASNAGGAGGPGTVSTGRVGEAHVARERTRRPRGEDGSARGERAAEPVRDAAWDAGEGAERGADTHAHVRRLRAPGEGYRRGRPSSRACRAFRARRAARLQRQRTCAP